MTTKRLSRSSPIGLADTAGANPFAVFEIIADARKIREQCAFLPDKKAAAAIGERAKHILIQADGMVKTTLGTSDLSTQDVPADVVEQIIKLLRANR